MRRRRIGRAAAVVVAALLVLPSACDEDAPEEREAQAPSVRLGFTQLLPEAGSRDALLRVENTAGTDLTVTGAGLAWSGYGEPFVRTQDIALPPGATRDLRVRLPEPRCDAGQEPVRGTVRSTTGAVTTRLTRYGEVFVRRLWQRQCGALLLRRTVRVEYGDRWSLAGTDSAPVAAGTLHLVRLGGDAEVEVTGVDGSVLYGLTLPGPGLLRGDEDTAALPLHVLPGDRCDEHARGQATAPYDFLVRLRVGDGTEVTLAPEVPPAMQDAATRVLDRACGGPLTSAD